MRILALLVVTNFLSIIPFNSLEKIRFCVFQGVQNLKSNMKWINLSILGLKTFKYQIPKEVIQDFFPQLLLICMMDKIGHLSIILKLTRQFTSFETKN